MPIAISKRVLSGSTHGQAIGITASQGVTPITIHQLSTSSTGTVDEIYLYANNDATAIAQLILEIGASSTNAHITAQVPPKDGPVLVLPGLILTGSACGIYGLVTGPNGTASDANIVSQGALTVYGYINRIVQS